MGDDYGGPERRTTAGRRSDDIITWRLATVEADVQSIERRVDNAVLRPELNDRFRAFGEQLAVEYVPRREHQADRDWTLRLWLGALSAAGLLIAAGELVIALRL